MLDPEKYDVIEVKYSPIPYDINCVDGRRVFTKIEQPEEIWIPAAVYKWAKNGSVYADTHDYWDYHHPIKRWYKKGEWRHLKDNKDNKKITVKL